MYKLFSAIWFNLITVTYFIFTIISSYGKQEVPGIAGFISLTGSLFKKMMKTDYYTPIHQPITQYDTAQKLLNHSEEATRAVGQTYTINTFDLGVCMKALTLVWKFPEKYQNHIIIPSPFHTEMNYIGMLANHKAWGSGYAEILLEAGLAEKGCLKNILSGKAFAKAMFNLKATVEALDRLLRDVFVEQTNTEIHPQALLDVIRACNRNNVDATYKDESTNKSMCDSRNKFAKGILEKTARFWIWFMDNAKLVLMLIYAVKTNNRKLFHKCNGEMANLFFAYDGQNYCRLVIIKKRVYKIKDGMGRICMLKSLRYIEEITTWFTFISVPSMV